MDFGFLGILYPLWFLLPFIVAAFVVRKFRGSLLAKSVVALLILVVVGINVRLPVVLRDLIVKDVGLHQREIYRQALVGPEDPVRIQANFEQLSFRQHGAAVLEIGANEGCMCIYLVAPKRISERYREIFFRKGIPYTNDESARYHLLLSRREQSGVVDLSMQLFDRSEKIASDRRVFRNKFWFEDDWLTASPKGSLKNWLLYVAQANVMHWLVGKLYDQQPRTPIDEFVSAVIGPHSDKAEIPHAKHAKAILVSWGELAEHRKFFPLARAGEEPSQYFCQLGGKWTAPAQYYSDQASGGVQREGLVIHNNGQQISREFFWVRTAVCDQNFVIAFRYRFNNTILTIEARRYQWDGIFRDRMIIELPEPIQMARKSLPFVWIQVFDDPGTLEMDLVLYNENDLIKDYKTGTTLAGGRLWRLRLPHFE